MAEIIRMPKLSDTMEEGVLVKWLKKTGDKVKSGELLAEIETDKATMEFESFYNGVLLYTGIKEGETATVNAVIAVIGEMNEDIEKILKEASLSDKKSEPVPATQTSDLLAKKEVNVVTKVEIQTIEDKPQFALAEQVPSTRYKTQTFSHTENDEGKLKASPLAKKLAKEKGIDIDFIQGSGDGGRIIKRDIESYSAKQKPETLKRESYQEIPLTQMRKTIAKRLTESKFTSPHYYLSMSVNMDKCIEARSAINEVSSVKISYNDIIILATALAIKENPKVNVSWLGDKIRYNNYIHIGVAVAVEDGLVVPVLRFADSKSLLQISNEVRTMIEKTKTKKLQPDEMQGNTFTISNLGMFDIDEFTAIINPPDSAILAIGKIKETPDVKNGQVYAGNIMKVNLSCDHRAIDGATGALFLQSFKKNLENPFRLIGSFLSS